MDSDGDNDDGTKTTRKNKSSKKKIEKTWSDNVIFSLISAVEQRRCLYAASESDYMLSKADAWLEVSQAIGEDGKYSVDDCKTKWNILRIVFKRNLNSLRKKKSGSGAGDVSTVQWKFFKAMLFVEAAELQKATESVSNLQLVIINEVLLRNWIPFFIILFTCIFDTAGRYGRHGKSCE